MAIAPEPGVDFGPVVADGSRESRAELAASTANSPERREIKKGCVSYTPTRREIKKGCGIQDEASQAPVYPDKVQLHWLYKETINRLDLLARRVSEGKCLDESLEFANYVEWSGIVRMMEQNAEPEPLKIDGAFLRWKCDELKHAVRQRYQSKDGKYKIEKSELEAISHKLDLIAGYVSKLPAVAGQPTLPQLRVIEGGLGA